MDFDPRDDDPRDEDHFNSCPDRHGFDHDRDADWSRSGECSRDRDNDARTFGRGPGSSQQSEAAGDVRDDARWSERARDDRERAFDPRAALTRDVYLPCGRDREREYTLRGSESRSLAAIGAFRVVSSRDLRDRDNRSYDPRASDLRHLREQKLVDIVRVPGQREHAVALTRDGRGCSRATGVATASTVRPSTTASNANESWLTTSKSTARTNAKSRATGGRASIERVVLAYELKSDDQTWLHERDRDRLRRTPESRRGGGP